MVEHLLNNPVYHALCTGDAHFAHGTDAVKFFDEEVSPFAGFAQDDDKCFEVLHQLLPADRRILHATPHNFLTPEGWQLRMKLEGLQFILPETVAIESSCEPVPLNHSHAEEMVQLAALTKPGPFNLRTIEFGHYYGIFENGRLAAMTGQRLHVAHFKEISAVCTHPDFLGKGSAAALMKHQINLIRQQGGIPFLHVRADNERAIALYERLGFERRIPMNFYFLKRED